MSRPVSLEQKREGNRRRQAKWRAANPDAHRKWRLPTRYGITLEQYHKMRIAQNDMCAICLRPETLVMRGRVKPLVVDHDHATGKVRGLLCDGCNVGLGKFKDSPNALHAAGRYLEACS